MTQVFISYSRKDILFIEQLVEDLKIADIEAWYDLSGLEGGSRWSKEIERAIRVSQYVIVVLSPDSAGSEWVEEEILYARKLKKKIIPLLYKTCEIPLGFHALNFIDIRGNGYRKNYKEILRALNHKKEKEPPERQIRENSENTKQRPTVRKLFGNTVLLFWGVFVFGAIALLWKPFFQIITPTTEAKTPQVVTTSTNTDTVEVQPTLTIEPTITPTSLPTEITDAKDVSMVLVLAGEFTMGANFYDGTEPEHQVYLDAFYIDTYEVTNSSYKACVDAGVCTGIANSGSYSRSWFYYWEPEYKNYPVIYVDWPQANLFCKWRGARLPKEAEWEKAARGKKGGPYPWGEGIDKTFANFGFNVGDTTEVGNYSAGKSTYGVYDMSGNVWEWVSSLYKDYPYDSSDGREDLTASGLRVIRGGAWDNRDIYLRVFARTGEDPSGQNFNLGFRCAMDVP